MSGLSRRLLAACVLLGLGAVCSAQNDTKKEAGRNPKVDSRSAKKGEAKQSQRDLNNSQSGILYGDDFAYTISAPKGWIMDDETARTSGLSVVFYRKGETWVKGKAVMYVNVLGRKQGATAKKAIANDIAEFKERNPKIKITQDKTLQTGDRRNAVTYVFSHVDDKTSDERVSYVEMPTVVLLIALTSQTSKDYKNAVADHTALVQSIGYLGVDKGGKGDKKVPVKPAKKTPTVIGYWYMGTATGSDCNLRIDSDHRMRVQYGGCYHQDRPLFASWVLKDDVIQIVGSKELATKLGTYLRLHFHKGNLILVPERETRTVSLQGYLRDHCFWHNLLGSKGLQLPRDAWYQQ